MEKLQILGKNPYDLIAAFRYGGPKMDQNVLFSISEAKFLCWGSFSQYFFSQIDTHSW